jgi:hypothetical protein
METKTSAKWTVKRFLLEEIWLWSLCLDEFVGRGEFRSRRWVAARICPWWVHAICNECGVCERKLFLVSFKRKRIPPLWRVINNRESKEIQNTNLTYCLVEMKVWGKKGVGREEEIPTYIPLFGCKRKMKEKNNLDMGSTKILLSKCKRII